MEENEKKCSFYKVITSEYIFYGCVRWLVLLIGVATLIILVFIPAMSYLKDPGEGTMSRLISMIINAMGVASLLLAIHSLTESRGSNKEIHEVTNKLEKLTACQETSINQMMEKLEQLGETQENFIHTMLKDSSTEARERLLPQVQRREPVIIWKRDYSAGPGTADPADSPLPPKPIEPIGQK